jgi:hypothetical protein
MIVEEPLDYWNENWRTPGQVSSVMNLVSPLGEPFYRVAVNIKAPLQG